MSAFNPGDMLSYSAGSTQTGPDGFRKINRAGLPLLGLLRQLFPAVYAPFGTRLPLVLNAYPASVGFPTDGVLVDCYLSFRTASRALQLAAREGLPVLILGQSLFIAELLRRHQSQGFAWPDALIALVGGYHTPLSLERAMQATVQSAGVSLGFVHGYGAAEVEAGMLLASERNAQGQLRYRARGADIHISTPGGRLHLALQNADGTLRSAPFDSGDSARADSDGWIIENAGSRLSPAVLNALESWTAHDWSRRTGYLRSVDGTLHMQLREGALSDGTHELGFYAYAERFGMSWLEKPKWG
ncbi:MAG: hypothetical protein Q7J29_07520 [Stagnimonas sp.]|nr:hypothetical protein [Stagnimonas sp.]